MYLLIDGYKFPFKIYAGIDPTDKARIHEYLLKFYRNYVKNNRMQWQVQAGRYIVTRHLQSL